MAEQLGEAVLTVRADTTQLDAGLQRARQQAGQAGSGIEQTFTKSGKAIQKAANGLEYFIDANGRARKITGQFVTVAELQAAGLDKLAGSAGRAGSSLEKLSGKGGGGGLASLVPGLAALTAAGPAVAVAAVGAAVVGIGAAATQAAGQIQKLNAAFTGLTGSAEAARQLRQDLFTLSKTTPFKNEEILSTAQRFLAVGVNAKNLQGTINRVGAIAAQSGQSLERLGLIYAQVYAKGRLQGEENLQFLEAGVDLTQELAVVTGKSGKALQEAMSKGQISIEDVNKAIVLATGDMKSLQQAGKAVDVAFNNISDNLGQLFGGFATSIAPALSATFGVINKILEQAFPSLDAIEKTFKPLTTEAERFAKVLGGNPELIASIAQATRIWAELIVSNVAGGLRTVNNILSKLDSKTLIQGFITAEFVARKLFLLLGAIGAQAAKNFELAARAITNPLGFAKEIGSSGGLGKFLDKEYADVAKRARQFATAQPITLPDIKVGDTSLQGQLDNKTTGPQFDAERAKLALQEQLNTITAQGLEDELRYKAQLLTLDREALRNGQQVSATDRLRLENEQAILAARRQVAAAQANLNAEMAKPGSPERSLAINELVAKLAEANAGVRKAYLDAGISLVQNARTAADALKSAQQSISGLRRSNFNLIPVDLQQREIDARTGAIILPCTKEHEIAGRWHILDGHCFERQRQLLITLGIELRTLGEIGFVVERSNRRCLRERVHIEGLTKAIHQISQLRSRNAKTDPQPRQTIGLGKTPRNDQVGKFTHPAQRVIALRIGEILGIGFIQHHRHRRRHRCDKGTHFASVNEGAGRIVRIRDKYQPRVIANRSPHRIEIVTVMLRSHDDMLRTHGLRGQRIDRKRKLRIHHRLTGSDQRACREFKDVIAAIAQRDPVGRHIEFLADGVFEIKAIRIRIARQIGQRRYHRLLRGFGQTQRIFIGSQFDDAGFIKAKFSRHLGNGLAPLIGSDRTNVIRAEIHRTETHGNGIVQKIIQEACG